MSSIVCFVRGSFKVNARAFRFDHNSRYFCSYRHVSVMQNENNCHETVWNPINLFELSSSYKYAVVVLNTPIKLTKRTMFPLWEKAEVTITVDGGTDRWIEYLGDLAKDVFSGKCSTYAPTMVTGDMDSILAHTRDSLESIGVNIIETPDQNFTDYTKCLMELVKHCKTQNIKLNGIYVIADSSGRFDHIIANINTLYKSLEFIEDIQVIQVANNSLTWLMRPGNHRIIIPQSLVRARDWCGLIPFGSRIDNVSTSGLEWNLDNGTMAYGIMVSTSNTYNKDCKFVTIDVNDKIVWTMGIEALLEEL